MFDSAQKIQMFNHQCLALPNTAPQQMHEKKTQTNFYEKTDNTYSGVLTVAFKQLNQSCCLSAREQPYITWNFDIQLVYNPSKFTNS